MIALVAAAAVAASVPFATAAITAAAVPERPFTVWTEGSMVRVAPEDPVRDRPDAAIAAARGEYESFQVVVGAGTTDLTGVDLDVSAFTGPDGAVIPSSAITRYREHYVEIDRSSPVDEGVTNRPLPPGTYPDALIPFVHPETGVALDGELRASGVTVAAGRNQPYWIDVLVPPGSPAGEYRGTYEVTTGQGARSGSVHLTVFDVDLPRAPALPSAVLNWSDRPSVDAELRRHRLMPNTSGPAADDPTLAAFNARDLGFYSGADQETCTMDAPPGADTVAERASGLREPGVLLYNYTADEVDDCAGLIPRLQEYARVLHAAGVAQLVTMTPTPELFTDGGAGRGVDVWVVLPKMYDAAPAAVAEAQRLGMQVWSYNTLVQDGYSPKWLIDFTPADFRVQPGFLNEAVGLTGLLYWRADNWVTDDPWTDVYTFEGGYPGEGLLVYPGEAVGIPGGAVPSMRLKWLRDGVDDYDYIALARRAAPERAAAAVADVAVDWRTWTTDETRIAAARLALAGLVEPAPR